MGSLSCPLVVMGYEPGGSLNSFMARAREEAREFCSVDALLPGDARDGVQTDVSRLRG
jgi:hypothetical protein